MVWLSWLYAVTLVGMSVFGFNLILLTALAAVARVRARYRRRPARRRVETWPSVLVQLPVFNERYVVERLIDAAAALDYPADRLLVQVLDDSTDETAALARARVSYHRARGRPVVYLHRSDRAGFKAGALAEGMASAPGELVAVFDADFVPPADFLRRLVPELQADLRLGMVQARWEHLNPDQSEVTRAIALALDSHFAVDQAARSAAGLLMNFNGSAGVWRRACIEDAGGWQGDTLAEDLDLSYRAQLRGWRLGYRMEVAAPAELPASASALKQQQFRWAKGSFQVLRKLGWKLLTARMSLFRKVQALLHLSGYLGHPLILLSLLLSLPVVLLHGQTPLKWGWLGGAGLGLPLVALYGQIALRRDWARRLAHYPALVMLGIGLALTTTHALWDVVFGRRTEFVRTPKLACAPEAARGNETARAYALPLDWTTWGELVLALYALAVALLAVEMAPGLAPFLFLYAAGFGYTSTLGFVQSGGVRAAKELSVD